MNTQITLQDNENPAEINQYLEQRFCQPVAKASHSQLFPLPIE